MPNLPPPPPGGAPSGTANKTKQVSYTIGDTRREAGERVVLYGTGGIGKTTLAAGAPTPVFVDAENGARHIDAKRVDGIDNWPTLISALKTESLWKPFESIILDGGDTIERWASNFVLDTKPAKDGRAENIEDYGYGKGYGYIMDEFMVLLHLLDQHAAAGRNIILVCHALTTETPNPTGEDYLGYEPKLQQPKRIGRIRDAVKDWCEHLFFIAYDIAMDKKTNRPIGEGTRTIFCQERPTFWAKSRTLAEPIPYTKGSDELWKQLLGTN